MFVNIDLKIYRKFVVVYKGLKVLYMRLQNIYMDCCAAHFYLT